MQNYHDLNFSETYCSMAKEFYCHVFEAVSPEEVSLLMYTAQSCYFCLEFVKIYASQVVKIKTILIFKMTITFLVLKYLVKS